MSTTPKRHYYSIRNKKNLNTQIEFPVLLTLFYNIYCDFKSQDYFQEAFGYVCIDSDFVAGTLGEDPGNRMFRKIRKPFLWPISDHFESYSEEDLFDVIEFLYDYISKPLEGFFHSYANCGWHYQTFDSVIGKREFREEINDILKDYKNGFELSENGEILELVEKGTEYLFSANIPEYDPENVDARMNAAILKFRRYRSSIDERRDAVRDLADVLEFLRPKVKTVISNKDEDDLFNIANNFGIRHHNSNQKTDYDKSIWYSWMFYYFLATIHAVLRLIKKSEESAKK